MSIKKGTIPPRYDEVFKAGAVKMVTEQGRPSKEVAAELGICIDTLKSRLKRAGFQPGATDRQNRNDKRQRELEAENRALRKQLAEKAVPDCVRAPAERLWQMRCLTMRSRYDRLVPGRTALGAASFFRRIITSAESRCQVNRGINATTSTKMKELLRFIPFFAEFYCLFFLGGHISSF